MTGDGLRPEEAISAVRRAVERSHNLPDDMTYVEKEPDLSGSESNIKLPILTFQPVSNVRITDFNTDQDGYVTDENGNHVGRVFTAEYRLDLQLDVWVAAGSSHDVHDLGSALDEALYPHDSMAVGRPFLDENGNPIETIWKFQLRDGQPANELTRTPALRRWRQDCAVWAYHRFDTTKDYTTAVNVPSDLSDSGGDGTLTG